MLQIAIEAAKKASPILLEGFHETESIEVSYKDAHNIVTQYDKKAEDIILQTIKHRYPDHSIFSEEAGFNSVTSEYLWIIDPLDGTRNFAHHIPYWAISIALLHNRKPVLSVVSLPVVNELFTAEAEKGSQMNGKKLTISSNTDLSKAFIVLERGQTPEEKIRFGNIWSQLSSQLRSSRYSGSIATDLCYVAAGRFDAAVINGAPLYDLAGGCLIAEEAGAQLMNFSGGSFSWNQDKKNDVIAGNKELCNSLQMLLKKI